MNPPHRTCSQIPAGDLRAGENDNLPIAANQHGGFFRLSRPELPAGAHVERENRRTVSGGTDDDLIRKVRRRPVADELADGYRRLAPPPRAIFPPSRGI